MCVCKLLYTYGMSVDTFEMKTFDLHLKLHLLKTVHFIKFDSGCQNLSDSTKIPFKTIV